MLNFVDLWINEGLQYLKEFEEQMGSNVPYYDRIEKSKRYMKILWQLENPYSYWSTPNYVASQNRNLKLRHFPGPRRQNRRTVLILPPQAGHHSNICDYSDEQSVVRVFQRYDYDVFVCHWLSCTPENKNLSLDDMIGLTRWAVQEVLELAGQKSLYLVGECQGGWQAAIYTALFPDEVACLVSAAAPYDLTAAQSEIVSDAAAPMEFFEYLVAIGGGMMDGEYILWGFKNMQPDEHYVRKYYRLWRMIDNNEEDDLAQYIRFQNWFACTQKLPGRFYLDIIKNIFKENNLTKEGAFHLRGRPVNLRSIRCPVVLMAGQNDHITPPAQAFALADLISSPRADVRTVLNEKEHIGTMAGNESLRENWTAVCEVLKCLE